jgi:RHS repeat-associated protein
VTETGVPVPGTDTVGYTQLNQLASVNSGNYTYDAADDVTGLVVPAQVTLQYDAANELTKLTAGTMVTKFSYDSRGDRLRRMPPSGPALTYVYDQTNRLVGFGSADTYAYAGDGLRMGKTVKGKAEAFTWDRSGPLPLLLRNDTVSYIYDPLGSPLEQVSSTGMAFFYLHDQLGSTRLVSNSSGAVQLAYTYDAYGNLLGKTGTLANPFGYAGQFTDSESELLYLRARYYDPTTAQFISRDPLVESTGEAYVYVGDNPLNGIDPTGLSWLSNWWNAHYDSWCANHPQICGGAESAGGNIATHSLPPFLWLPCSNDIKAMYAAAGSVTPAAAIKIITVTFSSLTVDQQKLATKLLEDLSKLPSGQSPKPLLDSSQIYQQIVQLYYQGMVLNLKP